MNNRDLIPQFILGAVSDDYEEPNQVYQSVSSRTLACGIPIDLISVKRILLDLVEQGLAKAYFLSPFDPPIELQAAPEMEEAANHYFWITPDGLSLFLTVRDSDHWPFDEEDDLKPGWTPTAE